MKATSLKNSAVFLALLLSPSLALAADEKYSAVEAADIKVSKNFNTNGFDFQIAPGPVQPTAKSLGENYHCPDWFRDAKFGIYMHWGLNSVAGFDGHYARYMYHQEEPETSRADQATKRTVLSGFRPGRETVYQYHTNTFGHPSKFGYKDFISLWKADKFDAAALAKLYKDCGAKYVGVMAVHHDNFDLYDSTYQPWNSVRMGPKRDIVGDWQKACAKEHLRFAVSSHLSNEHHEHLFYQGEADTTGSLKGVPYDTMDPKNDGLYGKRTPDRLRRVNPEFAQSWYRRTKELIDKYNPDLIYLDGGLPNGSYGLNLAAHFYNHYLQVNGKPEGVFTIKRTSPAGFTLDVESAGVGKGLENPWQVDTSINPGWFYLGTKNSTDNIATNATDDAGMSAANASNNGPDSIRLNAGQVVRNLADIVSKNGNMMLNVGLRPDGSLPETYRHELLDIGRWLKVNGEAIYATRPYKIFGEGPFQLPKGGGFNDNLFQFTAEDIRFTTKGDALYAIVLAVPTAEVSIKSLGDSAGKIESVSLLGSPAKLEWKQTAAALTIQPVKEWPCQHAVVFEIKLKR
jgi:alpha-L-fucosidase